MTGKSVTLKADTTYYLTSGIEYTVTESLTEEQSATMKYKEGSNLTKTPAQNETWTATITNVETKGRITILKKDDLGTNLAGAVFTLKKANGDVVSTVTTGAGGVAVFDGLGYGTYTLEETSAPAGYARDFETQKITIDDEHKTYTINALNKRVQARITLTKYVGIAENNPRNKANAEFGGEFVLQRSVDGNNWNNVTTDINDKEIDVKLNNSGEIVADVPAFDVNGKVYTYRFVETIPEGYYDPVSGSATSATSEEVKLVDDEGKAKSAATNVVMYNRQFVNISIVKNFYDIDENGGAVAVSDKTTTAKLYYYIGQRPDNKEGLRLWNGDGVPKEIGAVEQQWSSLPVYCKDGMYHYLMKEYDVEGYELGSADQNGSVVQIGGEKYVEINMASSSTVVTFRSVVSNYRQVIPVRIIKRNYYTDEQNISGNKVTIYTDESKTKVAVDAENNTKLNNVEIPAGNGITVFLKPGQIYYFDETEVASGWRFASLSSDGKIDLTKESQPALTNLGTKILTRYVYNKPYPDIRIIKVDSKNTSKKLSGAEFAVYTYDQNKRLYTPVLKDDGSPVTITTTNTNSGIRLEPGEYYFAETKTPEGYVDPNNNFSEYESMGYMQGKTTDGQTLTFIQGIVKDMVKSGKSDNICTFTFQNIPNKGSLKVMKYIDGAPTNIVGFAIVAKGDNGEIYRGTTGSNGSVTTVDGTTMKMLVDRIQIRNEGIVVEFKCGVAIEQEYVK